MQHFQISCMHCCYVIWNSKYSLITFSKIKYIVLSNSFFALILSNINGSLLLCQNDLFTKKNGNILFESLVTTEHRTSTSRCSTQDKNIHSSPPSSCVEQPMTSIVGKQVAIWPSMQSQGSTVVATLIWLSGHSPL